MARIPVVDTFGQQAMVRNGSEGLRFPHGIAVYLPWTENYIGMDQEINRPDLPYAGNTFIFV